MTTRETSKDARRTEQWVREWPELRTRTALVDLMLEHRPTRKRFFRVAEALREIGWIADAPLRRHALDGYWKGVIGAVLSASARLDRQGEHPAANELVSALRNVLLNALGGQRLDPWDTEVARTLRDQEHASARRLLAGGEPTRVEVERIARGYAVGRTEAT